jgi:hypothetical protein
VEDHLRSEQSITTELREMCCGVDWIRLDENRVQSVVEISIRIVYYQ